MNKLAYRMGHTKGSCGAIGILKENDITRSISPHLVKLLSNKFKILDVQPNDNYTYPAELSYGINKANEYGADYFVSLHANSATPSANGCEVLLYDMDNYHLVEWANGILKEMEKLGFYNRGIKIRKDLGELVNTKMPAMIIETFFCTSSKDTNIYNTVGAQKIAEAIARGFGANITSKSITDIAKEVINGSWGNNPERTNKLTAAGYDAVAVQNKVNELLGFSSSISSTPSTNIKVGSKVTLLSSAQTYATGEKIPNYVKNKVYTIQQVGEGKVLLKEIYSWVKNNDIV